MKRFHVSIVVLVIVVVSLSYLSGLPDAVQAQPRLSVVPTDDTLLLYCREWYAAELYDHRCVYLPVLYHS
jgi:hypothetical protein